MTTILLIHTNLVTQLKNVTLIYKEAVNSIYEDEDLTFCLNTDHCDCFDAPFCYPHHKHIIARDLQIIKNNKLGKFLKKGSKL